MRVLWSAVDDMLSALGEQRRVVAGVLQGGADQFVLDGSAVTLKVPRVLLEKIERLPQQVSAATISCVGFAVMRTVPPKLNLRVGTPF